MANIECLFSDLKKYLHRNTDVWMVLCAGCDLAMILNHAEQNHFKMVCVQTMRTLIEDNYIFKIEAIG